MQAMARMHAAMTELEVLRTRCSELESENCSLQVRGPWGRHRGIGCLGCLCCLARAVCCLARALCSLAHALCC